MRVIELFGGIGACSKALSNLNIEHTIVDYVEIDKYAVKSFNAIHGTNFEPQDIRTYDKDIECDLIMHGSPCQDFSLAGKQAGGDKDSGTRSSLLYETIRIVAKVKPKYVIWENVKNVISKKHRHNFDDYLEEMSKLGYTNYYQVLNAKDYGIPQNRERVFTVSILGEHNTFNFPQKQELKLKLKDMLEDEVDEKYYLSDKMIKYISATGTANFKNPDCKINLDVARPLATDQNKRTGTTNYLSDDLPPNYDLNKYIGTYDYAQSETLRPTDTSRLHIGKDISGSLLASGNHNGILIKEATKKGFKEAYDGDSINLEQPNSKTRRGRVGNQVAQTLTTSCNQGVATPTVIGGIGEKKRKERVMTLKEEYKLLTLQEMKEKQKNLENDLKYYLDRKETLFNRTQPGAIDYTKDSVQGGKRSNRYDDYVASVEELELNNDIDLIYKQIYSIQDWIAEKLRIIGEYEPLEQKIITLRELHKMKWDDISLATGYCDRQCRRIYSKYYKTKTGKRYEN